MSCDLKVLEDHRNELLLAEVAAWLHDMGKCAHAFLQPDGTGFNATNCQGGHRANPHKAVFETSELSQLAYWSRLSAARGQCPRLEEARHRTALWRTLKKLTVSPTSLDLQVTLPGLGGATVRELILWGRPVVSDRYQRFQKVLENRVIMAAYLGRAHSAAHIEKEESHERTECFISSPFGFEYAQLEDLDGKLQRVLHSLASSPNPQRMSFIDDLKKNFLLALGDTRRPENEVTLWDWSTLVAALYKAALAGALLGYQPQPRDLRWRLLSIQIDEVRFQDHITRLPDLMARQRLLQDGFERVRILLEETYPLGTEVYRDESTSLYVVPNLPNLAGLTDATRTTLEELIRRAFAQGTVANDPSLALSGEMIPEIEFGRDCDAWWGQRPDRKQPSSLDEVPPVGKLLRRTVSTHADVQMVAGWWTGVAREICPVCEVRPQAPPNSKAGRRNVCEVCEQRRDDRAKAWVSNLHTTIWTDEVADVNGRLALVVGRFDLHRWLDGGMVQTLLVTDPARCEGILKNPSFARIRRVWETTRTLWQELTDQLQDGTIIPQASERLVIQPLNAETLDLGPFHTYELLVRGVRLSVVWDAPSHRFITCDNLDYLSKPELLGQPLAEAVQPGHTLALEEPTGYGGTDRRLGQISIEIEDATPLIQPYAPVIPILAEPRTFMALVPADKALAVVQAIKAKYEQEMGKVRNRLPLALGVVYGGRRTPLAALLDAGRRMLRRPAKETPAKVVNMVPQKPLADSWSKAVEVTLRLGEREITIAVPTVMGDGTTHDVWYPYWQVMGKPTDRKRWFVGPDGEHWVHVADLRPGDLVSFTPSTFDYEYLDTSARRFEVSYGTDGQRRNAARHQRPYLLEEVDAIEEAWGQISRLSSSQIRPLEALVEAKRRDWGQPTGTLNVSTTFRQFVGDVLREAGVHSPALERAATTGMLADALEIHLTIHKDKSQQEDA